MTHTPTLPNGFSRDFSKARRAKPRWVLVWFMDSGDNTAVDVEVCKVFTNHLDSPRGDLKIEWALCWCPIPTPGHAVLKELAENANG